MGIISSKNSFHHSFCSMISSHQSEKHIWQQVQKQHKLLQKGGKISDS